MNLDGISSSYTSSAFTTHALSSTGPNTAWTVNLEGAVFGEYNVNTANNTFAYVDTASNMLLFSSRDYDILIRYIRQVPDMTCNVLVNILPNCYSNST
jgi:hypothetical protein